MKNILQQGDVSATILSDMSVNIEIVGTVSEERLSTPGPAGLCNEALGYGLSYLMLLKLTKVELIVLFIHEGGRGPGGWPQCEDMIGRSKPDFPASEDSSLPASAPLLRDVLLLFFPFPIFPGFLFPNGRCPIVLARPSKNMFLHSRV